MGKYTAMDCLELGSADARTGKNPDSLHNLVCTAAIVHTKFYHVKKTVIF